MTVADMISDTLEVAESFASDREIEFLESIDRRVSSGKTLTGPQREWLEDLHQRACRWEGNQ